MLETKFRPNRRIFVFWLPFFVQNGHHSKPKWLPYGAAYLTPCKYPFPLKSVHFWIFILAAILNILKTAQLWVMIYFLSQVSKGSAVRFEFNIFCTLITMAMATILNLFNLPKAATHYVDILTKVSWSLMKGIKIFFNPPFFCFYGNCDKVCPIDSDFFWLISFH